MKRSRFPALCALCPRWFIFDVLRILLIALIMLTTVAMRAHKPRRVVFLGDSITESGVLPGGYITKIKEAFAKKGVADQYELIGAGISGNGVYDLYVRLEADVLSKHPDVVVIVVGVNDVLHKALPGPVADAHEFQVFYANIIKKLQKKNIKLILCTPAVIGERTDNSNQQDGDLNLYSQIVRNLATKYHCSLCDLRKAFLDYNLKNNAANSASGILTTDTVHLNGMGNQLVADLLVAELSRTHRK